MRKESFKNRIMQLIEKNDRPLKAVLLHEEEGTKAFAILHDYFIKADPPLKAEYAAKAAEKLHELLDEHTLDLEGFREGMESLLEFSNFKIPKPVFGL